MTDDVRRIHAGSCLCGESRFFDAPHQDWLGIAMGAFDGPTHTRLAFHIFVSSKGDYYDIADGLPQHQG